MGTYIIVAGGNRPQTVTRGILEKGLGQSVIAGGVTEESLAKRGDCGVPNRTDAWGARVYEKGVIPDTPVDVRDHKYKGMIEFLPWGDPRGSLIVCRYLRGYQTLDLQYQNLVLNAEANLREDSESAADMNFLRFQTGENVYDDSTDPLLVQMYRIHEFNENSIYRDHSSVTAFMFREKDFSQSETGETKMLDTKFEALKIVKEAAADNSLVKLRNLLLIISPRESERIKDSDLYETLMKEADFDAAEFLRQIEVYKKEISDTVEKAKSFSAIDLTKHGIIAAGVDKKEPIVDGIPAKGEKMVEWLLVNFLDEKSFNTVHRLKQITDNL